MPKLPKPPKEVPQIKSTLDLVLGFRKKAEALLLRMHELGSPGAYCGESYRTDARQAFLAGFGRQYDDGRGVVTKALTAAKSLHGYRCAIDVWDSTNPNAPYTPKDPTTFYKHLRQACTELGIRSGMDWNNNGIADEKFPDRPHIQDMRAPVSPSYQDQADHARGDLKACWKRWNIEFE